MAMTAQEAFAEAERRVEKARINGSSSLDLSFIAPLMLLPSLHGLPQLQRLDISNTEIADLASLRNLPQLKSLNISSTKVLNIAPLTNLKKLEQLNFCITRVADVSPLQGLFMLQSIAMDSTDVSDIRPLAGLFELRSLDIGRTRVTDLSPLQALQNLEFLDIWDMPIHDIGPLKDLTALRSLDLSNTLVTDVSPLTNLKKLARLNLNETPIIDLRPLLELESSLLSTHGVNTDRLSFSYTKDTALLEELRALSEIRDPFDRTRKTFDYLRSLPPLPQPLPWEIPPLANAPSDPPEPEQDGALPLVIRNGRIGFDDTTTPFDPIIEAVIDEVRPLLDALARKGNLHDDVFALANELKERCAGETDSIDLLRLHLSYQKLNRLYVGRAARTDPFDDELITTLAAVTELLPGATLGEPKVGELIARQEANRAAHTPAIQTARARIVLHAINQPDAPFEDDLRDLAQSTAQPDQDDRLSGTAMIVARNVAIFSLKVLKYVLDKAVTPLITVWVVQHYPDISSFTLSMGDDVYWWAKAILDKLRSVFEARSFGP